MASEENIMSFRYVEDLDVKKYLMQTEALSPDKGRILKGDNEFQIKMAVPQIERLRNELFA